jgi:hypothetical protein
MPKIASLPTLEEKLPFFRGGCILQVRSGRNHQADQA